MELGGAIRVAKSFRRPTLDADLAGELGFLVVEQTGGCTYDGEFVEYGVGFVQKISWRDTRLLRAR